MKILLTVALLCATATPSAFAASPWDGTWKLDIGKSHFTGSTFVYSKAANGMWKFSDGSTISFEFAPDGKPYKTIASDPDDTMITTPDGDHALNFDNQFKGKTLSKMHEVLSADGKTLTDTTTNFHVDGTTTESTTVFTRVSAGTDFTGKWKSTKVNISAPDSYTISTPSPGTIKWIIPAEKETVEGKVDGSPVSVSGPTVPPGFTLLLKKASPDRMDYKVSINGTMLTEGHMVVTADGKWLTDTSWSPGKESEKSIGVYAKE